MNLTMEERERKKREWEDGKGDNCYIVSCRMVGSKWTQKYQRWGRAMGRQQERYKTRGKVDDSNSLFFFSEKH